MSVSPRDFGEHAWIAALALPGVDGEPAHDGTHVLRVYRNAFDIVRADGPRVDRDALAAACLLHDCVNLPKDHPDRALSSRLSADRAAGLMAGRLGSASIATMRGAIAAHSFGSGMPLVAVEDGVLRDADRLDALGAVGIARLFAVSGTMRRPLYDAGDPGAERRAPDDVAYALDHFGTKLLRLGDGFVTARGRELAGRRLAFTRDFLNVFLDELSSEPVGGDRRNERPRHIP